VVEWETRESEQDRPELDKQVKMVGAAWADSAYYDNAERWTHLFWHPGTEFRSLFDRLDLSWVAELACGHGRHSEQIARRAKHIAMIDIFEQNLEFCRNRLSRYSNIEYLKGDGTNFPLKDEVATAVFCYGAMVHFSPDMEAAYLVDTTRILKRGGMALYHHSNYAAPLDRAYGEILTPAII